MMKSILEIARHELNAAIRTKRAIWIGVLYLGSAILGGLAFVMSVRFIEKEVLAKIASQSGTGAATDRLALLSAPAYQKLAAFFAGVEPEQVALSFRNAVVVPFFFWGSLIFLPFLILFTSFDQVAADLQSRAILYSTIRARRTAILLGKALAQATLFVIVTVVGAAGLTLLATALLESFALAEALPAIGRMVALLIPFGLTYLAISSFASVLTKQPFPALLLAFSIMVFLRVLSWVTIIPEDHPLAVLRLVQWLSPSTYQRGLWLDDIWGPLSSVGAYAAFTVAFMSFAALILRRRDL
jgi:ABC-type transport system involved in multi-copper enzyme maturation permease subunit